jgi:predicted transport protein
VKQIVSWRQAKAQIVAVAPKKKKRRIVINVVVNDYPYPSKVKNNFSTFIS